MSVAQWSEYDEKMLSAFVAKPEKMAWYRDLYDQCCADGFLVFKWKWSWWAFFGGLFFPLYRKAYLAAIVVLAIDILLIYPNLYILLHLEVWGYLGHGVNITAINFFIGFCALTLCERSAIGGFTSYFVIRRYYNLKQTIENKCANKDDRVAEMARSGGVHKWAIVLAITLVSILAFFVVMILIAALKDALGAR